MPSPSRPAPTNDLGFDPAYLPIFEDKLFIEGPQSRRRLVNFFALLLFATVIATYGVLSDSTATVIGAMIVAPLMGPIMATTAAVVMGSLPRTLRALALVVAGVVAVIAFSFVLSTFVPEVTLSFTSNGEIASRIQPGLYALLTALGAGAAGAFISSRAEIADSIGGVAIAISLVPPLCVVGIALQDGQIRPALGALLLFLTNFLAILFAGGLVLWTLGLGAVGIAPEQVQIRRRGLIIFAVGILIIAIPLSVTTVRVVTHRLDTVNATIAVEEWLEGSDYDLFSVSVNEELVETTVEGSGDPPSVQALANQLAAVLRRPILVDVRFVTSEEALSTAP